MFGMAAAEYPENDGARGADFGAAFFAAVFLAADFFAAGFFAAGFRADALVAMAVPLEG